MELSGTVQAYTGIALFLLRFFTLNITLPQFFTHNPFINRQRFVNL
jgi:hypothetical protein